MHLRVLAAVAGLLGGLCWAGRWITTLVDTDPTWGTQAQLAGLVLLGLALAGVGAGLVSSSAVWLRLIVAVAFPVLGWSVYSVVSGESGSIELDGVIGAVATVLAAVGLVVSRRRAKAERRHNHPRGSHAR